MNLGTFGCGDSIGGEIFVEGLAALDAREWSSSRDGEPVEMKQQWERSSLGKVQLLRWSSCGKSAAVGMEQLWGQSSYGTAPCNALHTSVLRRPAYGRALRTIKTSAAKVT